ncbi:MAG: dGTP triphosphohydrolase, partial [Sphingobium limneticum]
MTTLASYACHPDASHGRLHAEPGGEVRGPRDVFQRDRDRIIHSIAFRRLRHKTQVFVSPDGDHFRVRLTHSLEVAQIGRTTARTLGLNEDLTEALCLAHDIGHPPFGHAGEDALEAALEDHGGFDHNAHTLRTLMLLESPYPRVRGLNLSWEMLEGLAKHNGPIAHPGWAMRELDALFPLNLSSHASLEAQLAAISDDIAYDNHDIDDGLRAGLLTLDQLLTVPFVANCWDRVRTRYPDVAPDRLLRELVREQIGVMANDLLAATRANIAQSRVETVEDVRALGRTLVAFSPELAEQERDLKRFMYATLYHHPEQLAAAD